MEFIKEFNNVNNESISDEEYHEINKFSNCDIDIATVEFRELTTSGDVDTILQPNIY